MSPNSCPFCTPDRIIFENDLAYVRADEFPVSLGHLLVISKRHVHDWFSLTPAEQAAMTDLLNIAKKYLDEKYHPAGYNVGVNCGESAGQTIFHVHLHLIPRYVGDSPNPRGGIRAVIRARQSYPFSQ